MSQENVEMVRRIFDLWNEGRVEPEMRPELFDPEVQMDLRGRKFNPAVYDGYDGIDRFVSDVAEVWDQFSIELVEVIDADRHVVSVMQATGRGQGSGIEVEGQMAWVLDTAGGACRSGRGRLRPSLRHPSRRASGVGDVAGERRAAPAGLRRLQRARP